MLGSQLYPILFHFIKGHRGGLRRKGLFVSAAPRVMLRTPYVLTTTVSPRKSLKAKLPWLSSVLNQNNTLTLPNGKTNLFFF